MKKEEVFVVIDSKKVAKKLKKVLDMFNEKCFCENMINYALTEKGSLIFNKENNGLFTWTTIESMPDLKEKRQQVSVSELKQILAMEHLKKCDSIICSFNKVKYIASFREFENGRIYCNRWYCIESEEIVEIRSYFTKFHRYATDEEKQLLNPGEKEDEKNTVYFPNYFKEVENPIKDTNLLNNICQDGVWRFIKKQEGNNLHEVDALVFDNGNYQSFGFDHLDRFINTYYLEFNRKSFKRNATQEEVAERFFKECHKLYPNKIGFKFNHTTNEITACGEIIFKNGTWLEAKKIEIDPFKELKEAHKKGFEIEYKSSSGQWKTSSNPAWRKTANYRIRPRKLGDWILTTNSVTNVKAYIQINETNINNVNGNDVRISNQMVIDILNNGKYTV